MRKVKRVKGLTFYFLSSHFSPSSRSWVREQIWVIIPVGFTLCTESTYDRAVYSTAGLTGLSLSHTAVFTVGQNANEPVL